jgi:hypothetical protein
MIRSPASSGLCIRIAVALSALVLTGSLAAMSEEGSGAAAPTDLGPPSKLDYLVLASIADSPHLLMAAYRSTAQQQAAARRAAKPAAAELPVSQ